MDITYNNMTINQTNTIYDFKARRKNALKLQQEVIKISKGNNVFKKKIKKEFSFCSQCKMGMSKDLADKQIYFKREFAPICIPCINGKPRKDYKETVNYKKTIKINEKRNLLKSKKGREVAKQWREEKQKNLKELEELFNR